jgi:hypothetical protein
MGSDDNRTYIDFYGIDYPKYPYSFGAFSDHSKILVREYINEACDTNLSGEATDTHEFFYPHHIKKKYWIEGVIEGQITFTCSDATATVDQFRVTVGKVNEQTGLKTDLATTGWITVYYEIEWDSTYSIGHEKVQYYSIDCWEEKRITEHERIYLKVETSSTDSNKQYGRLMYSNDSTWEDLKVTIPFRL